MLDPSYLLVGNDTKVRFLREESSNKSVEVFVRSPFPGMVGVSEETTDVEFLFKFLVSEILASTITSEGFSYVFWQYAESFPSYPICFFYSPILRPLNEYYSGNPFVCSSEVDRIRRGGNDGIIFPVTNLFPCFNGHWSGFY